jgi:hypothetical protein
MEATREEVVSDKILQALEGEGSVMSEAWTDVVNIVVDESTSHTTLVLTEEA